MIRPHRDEGNTSADRCTVTRIQSPRPGQNDWSSPKNGTTTAGYRPSDYTSTAIISSAQPVIVLVTVMPPSFTLRTQLRSLGSRIFKKPRLLLHRPLAQRVHKGAENVNGTTEVSIYRAERTAIPSREGQEQRSSLGPCKTMLLSKLIQSAARDDKTVRGKTLIMLTNYRLFAISSIHKTAMCHLPSSKGDPSSTIPFCKIIYSICKALPGLDCVIKNAATLAKPQTSSTIQQQVQNSREDHLPIVVQLFLRLCFAYP
ncbi:hypothetical protein J6590_063935 [Homalodisca vitripennis]|nr:hypothetical protein J6590_063935 [Homalodisca vitripennis]